MTKYIYQNCMGQPYISNDADEEYETCSVCGDCSTLIGRATNREEALNLFKKDVDEDGMILWNMDYVEELVNENFRK